MARASPSARVPKPLVVREVVFVLAGDTHAALTDPHNVGFDGTAFEFQGFHGGVFNLVSETNHQVNMQLDDLGHTDATFIRALGIQMGATRIAAEAASDGTLLVEVNGQAVNMVNASSAVYDSGCVVIAHATEDTYALTTKVRIL